MSFFKLMVFKMGKHKGDCPDNCGEDCSSWHNNKCRLYSCKECGLFIEEGEPVVRVMFQSTYNVQFRKKKELTLFVNYHLDCYKRQEDRWIESKLRS